jgi:HAD superfamily hydrolase (TIGR01509 family)
LRYALVFDFGGVIMKTATREPRWAWDDRLGVPRGTVERAVHNDDSWRSAQTGQLQLEAYYTDVARRFGLTPEQMRQLEADFYSGDRLDLEIIDLIRSRRGARQRVALLSNDSPALIWKLDSLGISSLFDPLVVSAEIGVMKPAPAAYHAVLGRLNCPPGNAVFIDDLQANIEGARQVGMVGIHYLPGLDLAAALQPYFK